jgi:NADH:ubiquinone oxidoreductase subunit E
MGEEIYFQWQNEHLLKTIYPLREMKLRDFLVYVYEIDIWAQYKDKKTDDIREEVQAYIASQRAKLIRALEKYQTLFEYFTKEDVTDEHLKVTTNSRYGDDG